MGVGRRLKLHLVDKADFAKYQDSAGLFVPGADSPAVGEEVTIEVVFQGGPRVLLHGTVTWRRATGDARTRPGAGVSPDPGERSKLEYISGYARGGLLNVRGKRRLPVRLRVTYSGPRGRRINFTRDLHEEGAFVRTAELLDLGAKTTLLISPPGEGYRPVEVEGVVARQQSEPDRGVGVRFEFKDENERERMRGFMTRLEAAYLDGTLPDDVIM